LDIKLESTLNYWVYFGVIELVLVFLIYAWKKEILGKFVRYAFGVVLILFLATSSIGILLLYKAIKQSPLAAYLLAGPNSFFAERMLAAAESVGGVLILAAFLYFLGWLVTRFRKTLAEKEFPLILGIIGIVAGLINILPVILLGLILAIIWQIIKLGKTKRISLTPFLLSSAISVNALNLFSFYQKFLSMVHLI
jgi:hypothetical protein